MAQPIEAAGAVPEMLDVCGQPGGPSPEEQARVDAEQLKLMAANKVKREAEAKAERDRGVDPESKTARFREAQAKRTDIEATVARLLVEIEQLKAKVGLV